MQADSRVVGMEVWYIPPHGEHPQPLKVIKVTKMGVTCDDGYRYNLREGDRYADRWGSSRNGCITIECQKNRIEKLEAEKYRNKLMLRYRRAIDPPLSNEQIEQAIVFFEALRSSDAGGADAPAK
jgi:hypothetical protein